MARRDNSPVSIDTSKLGPLAAILHSLDLECASMEGWTVSKAYGPGSAKATYQLDSCCLAEAFRDYVMQIAAEAGVDCDADLKCGRACYVEVELTIAEEEDR